jgi:hypothetical protein
MVFTAPLPPPTATHRPFPLFAVGENAIELTALIGVPEILMIVQFAPPFVDFNIVFIVVPARIVVKAGFAAKHFTIVPVYVANDASTHAADMSESPEYIIRPLLLFVTSLPPINHRLYTPPTHNEDHTQANFVEFGLLIVRFQLNPSFERDTFCVALAMSPPVARNRVRFVFIATEQHPLLATVIPVPPLFDASLEPGTRDHEEPASAEYVSAVCDVTLSVTVLVRNI